MSMDRPTEMEKLIELYAESVRDEYRARKNEKEAATKHAEARDARQQAWREVKGYVLNGRISPGVYRLNGSHYCEGLVIDLHKDYPDLLPMFR